MGGTSCSSTDPIHILVAFGGVLGKVDPGTKHATDVGVALIKALVNDGVDEGRTWQEREKHVLVKVRKDTSILSQVLSRLLYGNLNTFQHNLVCFVFKIYNKSLSDSFSGV